MQTRSRTITQVIGQPVVKVAIVEPLPTWAAQFRVLAAELRSALGPLAQRIDHIGSTSVPGLAAKDIIDIQVAVDELSLEDLEPKLRAIQLQTPQPHQIWEDHVPAGLTETTNMAQWQKL